MFWRSLAMMATLAVFSCDPEPSSTPEPGDEGGAPAPGMGGGAAGQPGGAGLPQVEEIDWRQLIVDQATPADHSYFISRAADGTTSYEAFGAGFSLGFRGNGLSLVYESTNAPTDPSANLDDRSGTKTIELEFVGADPDAFGEGLGAFSPSLSQIDSTQYQAQVTAFEALRFYNVYPGIDLYYLDTGNRFAFVFVLGPGANPANIEIESRGGDSSFIDDQGTLVVTEGTGEFTVSSPVSYQPAMDDTDSDLPVSSEFANAPDGSQQGLALTQAAMRDRYTIELGSYDATRQVVIDPTISFTSLLGNTVGNRVMTDPASGDVIVGGTSPGRRSQAFYLSRHDGVTGELIQQTLIHATPDDALSDVFVHEQSVFISGTTNSNTLFTGFSSSPASFQSSVAGSRDAFVMQLQLSDFSPIYGSYFGGSGDDFGVAVRADGAEQLYLAGHSNSPDYPGMSGAESAARFDNFVAKFSLAGDTTELVYSQLFGGSLTENITDADLDDHGNFYVAGRSTSNDYPQQNQLAVGFASSILGFNPVITSFSQDGAMTFSTYAHNDDVEAGIFSLGMDVTPSGDAIAFGGSLFDEQFVLRGYQLKLSRGTDGDFALSYSYKPVGENSIVQDVAFDSHGLLYSVGESPVDFSSDGPTPGLANISAFLTVLADPFPGNDQPEMVFGRSFGGGGNDRATNISFNTTTNEPIVVGTTTSNPFNGVTDDQRIDDTEQGFIVRFAAVVPPEQPNQAPVANLATVEDLELNEVEFRLIPRTINLQSRLRAVWASIYPVAETSATVTFDATGSTDPEGENLAYTFDIVADGATEGEEYTSPLPRLVLDLAPGQYTVSVTVCDAEPLCTTSDPQSFAITIADLSNLTTDDITLNGVHPQRVNHNRFSFFSWEILARFDLDDLSPTIEPGDDQALVLDGAVTGIDHVKVIDRRPFGFR